MNKSHSTPDVRELAGRELPESVFPAEAGPFRIYFEPEAHKQILAHVARDTSVEVGGVLIGAWQRDQDGPFLVVQHVICSELAASGAGEVTFTHDAWAEIHRQMDAEHPDLAIVGWYHSHPDFGIFLSERDRFIHEHFFGEAGQIAFVVDPIRQLEGVFIWRQGKTARSPHYWIGNRIQTNPPESEDRSAGAPARSARSEMPQSDRADQTRLDWLPRILAGTLLLLIGFLLAGLKDSWERARLIDGVIAHFGTMKVLRPGLRENLELVESEVHKIEKELAALQREGDPAAKADARADGDRLLERLRAARNALGRIREAYGLDHVESALLARRLAEDFAALRGGVPGQPRGKTPRDDPQQAGETPRTPSPDPAAPSDEKPPPGEADASGPDPTVSPENP